VNSKVLKQLVIEVFLMFKIINILTFFLLINIKTRPINVKNRWLLLNSGFQGFFKKVFFIETKSAFKR